MRGESHVPGPDIDLATSMTCSCQHRARPPHPSRCCLRERSIDATTHSCWNLVVRYLRQACKHPRVRQWHHGMAATHKVGQLLFHDMHRT
jgi:hypothetical protein